MIFSLGGSHISLFSQMRLFECQHICAKFLCHMAHHHFYCKKSLRTAKTTIGTARYSIRLDCLSMNMNIFNIINTRGCNERTLQNNCGQCAVSSRIEYNITIKCCHFPIFDSHLIPTDRRMTLGCIFHIVTTIINTPHRRLYLMGCHSYLAT